MHYSITVGAGQSHVIRLRLSDIAPGEFAKATSASSEPFGAGFGAVMAARRREADEFYASVIPATLSADAANVMRQALAGMLWSKQFYYYDIERWLKERDAAATAARRETSIGTTCTTPTSSRCRTSGSIRGTRPGISPSISLR